MGRQVVGCREFRGPVFIIKGFLETIMNPSIWVMDSRCKQTLVQYASTKNNVPLAMIGDAIKRIPRVDT